MSEARQDYSLTTAEAQTRAAAAIRGLLKGAPPNGTDPATIGPWAEDFSTLANAPDLASRQRIFDALVRDDPGLARLVAGDPVPLGGAPETILPRPAKFTPFPADDLDRLPPVSWHIAGEIPRQSFGALFGPTGSGKSFFALDRALILAQTAPVVYVAAEGAAGYAARKIAWCKQHKKGSGQLWFVGEAVNLLDPTEALAFTTAILPLKPALVIFDTLARCMIGGDENSARDMGLLVATCDDLRAVTGATVLVVHHTGKTGQVERGSSALRAACDFMLSLVSDDGLITLTCEKSKDAEPFEPRSMRLVICETGRPRADGTPETSCVILPSEKIWTAGMISPKGGKILETLALESFRDTGGRASVLVKVTGLTEATFYRAISDLVRDGYARQDAKGDPYYITAKGEKAITPIKVLS